MPDPWDAKARSRDRSFAYSKIQSIAERSEYPTRRPGPSMYQSSPEASLVSAWCRAPSAGVERYVRIRFVSLLEPVLLVLRRC